MAAIVCDGLRKSYDSVRALDGMSFSVDAGCIGFVGPNGGGKTTTMRILAGLASPNAGRASVAGLDVVSARTAMQRQIGYLPQSPTFYGYMTAREVLTWTASLFGMDRRAASVRADELLGRLGLAGAAGRSVGTFSGGMKQRLGIAQALVHRPNVLILDEPVSALDPIGRREVLQLIEELKAEVTVFMSSHVLSDVERVADHLVIVHGGRVVVQADPAELRARYETPRFAFEVEPSDPDLTEMLRRQPWCKELERQGSSYSVLATDAAQGRAHLPRAVLDAGATLVSYGGASPTLEDIFVRVVADA